MISDAGYQGEITNVSTACTQLEVFSRVLRTCLANILDSGGEAALDKHIPDFAVLLPNYLHFIYDKFFTDINYTFLLQKMVCHAEHTYLYAQAVMAVLSKEKNGGSVVRRISQEVQKYAKKK